jgi:hypothetical protein
MGKIDKNLNSLFYFLIGLVLFLSIISNLYMIFSIDKIISKKYDFDKITGESVTDVGKLNICLNNPPSFLSHDCIRVNSFMDGYFKENYSCILNSTDIDGNDVSYILINNYSFLNLSSDGNLSFYGHIDEELDNITLGINLDLEINFRIEDDSSCLNNYSDSNISIELFFLRGGVELIQNYPNNFTDQMYLKETYTTFHRSLDEYFRDVDGYKLSYFYNILDIHCFLITININETNNLVSYTPRSGSHTTVSGPCRIEFTASNLYGSSNKTNIVYLNVEKTESNPQLQFPSSSSGGGGGGGSGGAMSIIDQDKIKDIDCKIINISCSEWSSCIFIEDTISISNYSITNDGIQTRECTWATNCPGRMAPAQKRSCDYKPTCFDNIKNCHELEDGSLFCEEDIDCGGPCPSCASCFDFIKNQGELGVDCGGPCEPCSTCFDGIKNCYRYENKTIICEEDIDCGGPCAPCPTCFDGIKNCHRLLDGSIHCEEGVDCGGPCAPCIHLETPLKVSSLKNLIYILIFGLFVIGLINMIYFMGPSLLDKIQNYYILYLKKKIILNKYLLKNNYLSFFEKEVNKLKTDFDTVTLKSTKEEGDKYLTKGDVTGYNIDRYSVSFDNDYSDIIMDDSRLTITYSMYLNNIKHGKKVLEEISKLGIKPNYLISKKSSAVLWNEQWASDSQAEYEVINGKYIARTVEYNLTFLPKNEEEAKIILKVLELYGKGKKKIEGAWDIPDIRVTGVKEILDYERRIVNTKSVGGQKIIILTKNKPLPGFKESSIFINPALAEYVK